jgi:dipeptidyl aminopeptidase/acylaminoacyl peptidase
MKPFGGIEQLAWSPDGKTIAYTCRKKSGLDYAISTNSDIYLYDICARTHTNLTQDNFGYDTNPSYSPDGQWIAWQSMERDGYESDENRLMIQNLLTGERRFLTQGMETNVDSYYWKDDNHLVFSAVWHATSQIYEINLQGERTCLTIGQYDYIPAANIGNTYYCLRHSMREANEIFRFKPGEEPVQITRENDNIYSQITMGNVVPRWQKTTDGQQMLTWIIYPPHFDPNKKYPTLLYCEGGPQSPVSQFWSFRWNFMMMAANDYIIVAPNRRGLPGFGNEWNEQISGDYGGQCMKDYLTAIDEFVATEPYVDKDHLGCVGASFGGFSVYWLAGHHNKRFKAFIAHDGIFNMEMQYLETEEKWFANWDMGGAYWDKNNKIAQRTFANSPHLFVDKWDAPILCIHGEKDFRILANQGMAAFDAAKMRGVDAQLLIFPDENHWVLQPQNGILWQRTFFEWLDKYLK